MKFKNIEELRHFCVHRRIFNADWYIESKVRRINEFFQIEKLDAAVLGMSGGVDSAVTYALLLRAMDEPGSPIKRVVPMVVPIRTAGTSGQSAAVLHAFSVVEALSGHAVSVDLTDVYEKIVDQMDQKLRDPWAGGQMASVLRTPIFYYQAAILQSQGYRSIVVGTTNRDEGSYIGFFGKASDGMVDLQPIADLHKMEVWEVARKLDVPESVVGRTPCGDVWDQRTDEMMIGAPYWFLQTYLLAKEYNIYVEIESEKDRKQYFAWANAIEDLHAKNQHKYQVGSPARYIDVQTRIIKC